MLGQKRKLEDVEGEDVQYVDPRQSILTISICKLKMCPARRVEPSLRRSVLIFNTLKIVENELQHEGLSLLSSDSPKSLPDMQTDVTLDILPDVGIASPIIAHSGQNLVNMSPNMCADIGNVTSNIDHLGPIVDHMTSTWGNVDSAGVDTIASVLNNIGSIVGSVSSSMDQVLPPAADHSVGIFPSLMDTSTSASSDESAHPSEQPTYTSLCTAAPIQSMETDCVSTLSELTDSLARQTVTDLLKSPHLTMPFSNLSMFRFNDAHFDTEVPFQELDLASNAKLPPLNTEDVMHTFNCHSSNLTENFLPLPGSQGCKGDVICEDFDTIMQVLVGT